MLSINVRLESINGSHLIQGEDVFCLDRIIALVVVLLVDYHLSEGDTVLEITADREEGERERERERNRDLGRDRDKRETRWKNA